MTTVRFAPQLATASASGGAPTFGDTGRTQFPTGDVVRDVAFERDALPWLDDVY